LTPEVLRQAQELLTPGEDRSAVAKSLELNKIDI
jgi:hypothetical protein